MSHPGEVFTGGATTSQHVEAEDDSHFENTTFKLKRTRSMGLLDEFIQPSESEPAGNEPAVPHPGSSAASEPEIRSPGSPEVIYKSPEILPHDDTDIVEEPSQHVDYLSHQWDVFEISKSWRYVINKRKDVANSARLENASWRTWAQRRSNLKTISPEVVNWSKDSDVTWLYGPILKDDDSAFADHSDHRTPTTTTSKVAGDISLPNKLGTCIDGPKPILKRRTVHDMMISHSNLLKLQLATTRMHQKQREKQLETYQASIPAPEVQPTDKTPDFADYDAISAKLNSQYANGSNSQSNSLANLQSLLNDRNSTTNLSAIKDSLKQVKGVQAPDTEGSDETKNQGETPVEAPEEEPKGKARHIHFNEEVQQCIAVNTYDDDDDYDEDEYDDSEDDYYHDDLDESEDTDYIYENLHGAMEASVYNSNEDEYDDDDEEDEDEDGGFFLKVKSSAPNLSGPGFASSANNKSKEPEQTDDTASISTTNSKVYRTIQLLPSTNINYGSSDEDSDEENPYTSSLSHNVNNSSSRGYDYYYDYNTVYTVDPNHSIYGSNKKAPDVVDVPENIGMGSNIEYDAMENDEYNTTSLPEVISPTLYPTSYEQPNSAPVLEQAAVPPPAPKSGFQLHDDDEFDDSSDDNSDEGLSISARSSSHSLAQQVFGNTSMTPSSGETHFPEGLSHPQPVNAPVMAINPRHSSTSISKQPHSSSTLSQLFFGGEPSTGLTKQKASTNSLSDQFFGGPSTGLTKQSLSSLSQQFFGGDKTTTLSTPTTAQNTLISSPDSFSSTQRKSSPLPPHTTSMNAFLGNTTPPPVALPSRKNTFSFEDSDSDSDSEAEAVPLSIRDGPGALGAIPVAQKDADYTPSYATLSQVAGRNGISSPSPDVDHPSNENYDEHDANLPHKNIVGQAKGLANHFLGGWKHNVNNDSS